ncbi:MAG: hypothetical protein GWP91_25130 [Rhodobacterales bacterium]|nr:hypothetical protein [Rhodobacterales bacterium]
MLLAMLCGCGPAHLLDFGPDATVSATDIIPGCEGVTALGEFSSTILARINDSESSEEELLVLDHLVLGDGESADQGVELSLGVDFADEVCIWSTDSEENDDFSDDPLNDDEDCKVMQESRTDLVFALSLSSGDCMLSISIPAVINTP